MLLPARTAAKGGGSALDLNTLRVDRPRILVITVAESLET